MDPDILPSTIVLAIALLAVNAYFVIAEFAVLTLHRSRSEQIAQATRDSGGITGWIFGAFVRPEELLLVAQLGSSAATLLLGYVVGTSSLALLGRGPLGTTGAIAVALAVAMLVHTVLAEQIPKLLGIHYAAHSLTRLAVLPLRLLALILRPIAWSLAWVVRMGVRVLGVLRPGFQPLTPTPDEIRSLVSQGHEQGVVEEDESEMIHGIFEFSDTVAREVMTPRIDMVAVPVEISLDELVATVVTEGHSRLPVYDGTIDAVVGVLLAKDLLPLLADPVQRIEPIDVRALMREPYFVPDTKPVDDLLAEFRQQKVHLAIVLDEFGGTYGLVTMEDLLEEIVGEINDEYDVAEPDFTATPDGDVLIDGGAQVSDVNETLGLALPEEDFDTIGGFIFGALGRVPVPGDEIRGLGEDGDLVLHVEETEERRIVLVRLTHAAPVEETVPEN